MESYHMCNAALIILIRMAMRAKDRIAILLQSGEQEVIWRLVGYDWAPFGVDLATSDTEPPVRYVEDPGTYVWQQGATVISEIVGQRY